MASKPPARVFWGTTSSPIGKLAVGLTEKGEVCRLSFLRGKTTSDAVAEWQAEWSKTEFKKGADLDGFEEKPILLIGTPFQQAAWRAIAAIPSGKVRTYSEIASRIGKPGAARAVGTACKANPVPYLIPCHRVVASGGGLGGFSGGLDVKKALLCLEEEQKQS